MTSGPSLAGRLREYAAHAMEPIANDLRRAAHALNDCQIHADVDNVGEQTACALCAAAVAADLAALRQAHAALRAELAKLAAPEHFGVLPVRWDGTDLLDATGRILVWDGDADNRTGSYLARLINGIAALNWADELAPRPERPAP